MKHTAVLRLSCLVLALLCAASGLAGCAAPGLPEAPDESPSTPEAPPEETVAATLNEYPLTLPWYRNEGYNPYLTANSLTLQLADLLFEKLLVIDPDGALEHRVVRAVDTQDTTVTLTLAAGYRYADGSAVTAADVAASLEAARSSQLYRGRFANVLRVSVTDETTVTLQLQQPDHLFAWLLDIPVMPAGQTASSTPMTSGRYTYGTDGDVLVPNPLAPSPTPFDRIALWEMTGADALANSLNIGAISLYSSETEGLANGINSSRQAGYYTNTLVFLGFNSIAWRSWKTLDDTGAEIWHTEATGSAPMLADARSRQAVEALLERALLLEKVYYNQGHIATGFLNTIGPEGGHGTLTDDAAVQRAQTLLAQMGFTQEMDGYYHDRTAGASPTEPEEEDRLTLRLLVYSGSSYKRYLAQLIAESLASAGLFVAVEECDSMENYQQKLALLDFDMYIGEIKLYNNMDMSAFLTEGGAANAGITVSETLLQTCADWRAGATSAAALEQALAAEMPWAPLLWRSGTLYYDKALEGFRPSSSSVFYGMEALRLA